MKNRERYPFADLASLVLVVVSSLMIVICTASFVIHAWRIEWELAVLYLAASAAALIVFLFSVICRVVCEIECHLRNLRDRS